MSTSNFDTLIRFRAPKSLRDRLETLARHKFKTVPELGREAVAQYVTQQERTQPSDSDLARAEKAEVAA